MRLLLTLLCSGLFLVCCKKQDKPVTRNDATLSTSRVTKDRHSQRDRFPDKPAAPDGTALVDPPSDTSAALQVALQAAIEIESPADRSKAIAELAWNAIENFPDIASQAFLQLPEGSEEKRRLIQHYAMRLAEQDLAEALSWASSLGSEQEIAVANAQIALVIAESDPYRAANLLSESGLINRDFDVAVVQVVQRWAAQSPADASAWVTQFPSGAAREAGIRMISEQWLPRDASAAFAWLSTTTDTKLRSEIARAMEGILLKSPKEKQDLWRQKASPSLQEELLQQRSNAMLDVGNDLPPDTHSR
jgi:hypothetical protein